MTTTAQCPVIRTHRRGFHPFLTRAAAAGCSTLLAVAALTAPAAGAGTGTTSPSPEGSAAASTSPTPDVALNQDPQLECGGVMTQTGSTESIRVSATDPDGDPVTLSAGVSMFGVQPTVSGHVITYPAPTSATGQDNFVVLASDGQGGEAHCEIGVLVQPGSTSPSPTPTPTPTTPAPSPSTPAPEPPTDAPTPTPAPQPTSDSPAPEPPTGAPTPTPTSRPSSPDPTTAPATPGTGPDDESVTSPGAGAPSPGRGSGEDSDAGMPGGAGGTNGGADGEGPGTGTDATEGSDDGSAIVLPPRPEPGAGTGSRWAGVIPMELGAGSMRALANAEKLLEGIDSDLAARGSGDHEAREPDADDPADDAGAPDSASTGAGEDRDAEAGAVHVDRAAATGASGWLFGVVGALMIALVGLALMALPRGRGRH